LLFLFDRGKPVRRRKTENFVVLLVIFTVGQKEEKGEKLSLVDNSFSLSLSLRYSKKDTNDDGLLDNDMEFCIRCKRYV
jgi:hypothetical protein